jgi:trehalose-phosphatase
MTRYLFDEMWSVGEQVSRAQAVLLCLEFDGVLVPAREEEAFVCPSPQMQRVLWSLARQRKFRLAFLSYRSRFELQTRIGLPDVWYVGCHGLELSGPGEVFVHPSAAVYSQQLQPLAARLSEVLRSSPDLDLEDRGLTLRVPLQNQPASLRERITDIVHDLTRRHAPTCRLIVAEDWLEVRPDISWDRSAALERVQASLDPFEVLAVYLGSDEEEGTFRSLGDAVTVRTGECERSEAQYYVAGPPDVRRFLEWVSGLTREQHLFAAGASF